MLRFLESASKSWKHGPGYACWVWHEGSSTPPQTVAVALEMLIEVERHKTSPKRANINESLPRIGDLLQSCLKKERRPHASYGATVCLNVAQKDREPCKKPEIKVPTSAYQHPWHGYQWKFEVDFRSIQTMMEAEVGDRLDCLVHSLQKPRGSIRRLKESLQKCWPFLRPA